MSVTADTLFHRAAAGLPCWIGDSDGSRERLPTARWMGGSASSEEDRRADHAMISRCTGSTIDLGCGPGRLTEALARRGLSALGVDTSKAAVDLTIGRGGNAVLRDLFEPLPGTGTWSCVLLADGNIGIGGDPVRLLRRAADQCEHPLIRGVCLEGIASLADPAAGAAPIAGPANLSLNAYATTTPECPVAVASASN